MTEIPSAFTHVRDVGAISEFRLRANGLTVLVLPDAAVPVASFMVTYRVGSRNEGAGLTGATHLLEHLMFKGSERFNKDLGTSVFQTLQRVGGQVNATTWLDRTNYYSVVPKEHLALAAEIEADRMRHARVRDEDLASERSVVLNELDRGENDPRRKLMHAVWAAAFFAHPYRHPTIGWRSDVETVTAAGLRHFYDTYYWPSNATVSVIGDVEVGDALDVVNAHFGQIPGSPAEDGGATPLVAPTHRQPDRVTREPDQQGERRVVVRQAGQLGAIMLAHKAPPGLHSDADALAVLAEALGGGRSSRLHRRLVDEGLATASMVFYPHLHDPGLFMTFVMLAPDVSLEEVEAATRNVLAEVVAEGLTEAELLRARRQARAEEAFGRDGPFAAAAALNECIALGDWTRFITQTERIAAVTAEDVQRVARLYLNDDHLTVGHYDPEVSA